LSVDAFTSEDGDVGFLQLDLRLAGKWSVAIRGPTVPCPVLSLNRLLAAGARIDRANASH
jgi:hypothetical protein